VLGGGLGDRLEGWERARKLRKFAPAAGQAGSAAELDSDHVKGHFDDHGHPILRQYYDRLSQLQGTIEAAPEFRQAAMSMAEEAAD
jgi:hypothetical protein